MIRTTTTSVYLSWENLIFRKLLSSSSSSAKERERALSSSEQERKKERASIRAAPTGLAHRSFRSHAFSCLLSLQIIYFFNISLILFGSQVNFVLFCKSLFIWRMMMMLYMYIKEEKKGAEKKKKSINYQKETTRAHLFIFLFSFDLLHFSLSFFLAVYICFKSNAKNILQRWANILLCAAQEKINKLRDFQV